MEMTATMSFIFFFRVVNCLNIEFFVRKFFELKNSTLITLHDIVCLCLFSGWIQLMSVHFSIKGYEKSRSLNNIAGLAGNALRLSPVTSPYNSPCPLRRGALDLPSHLSCKPNRISWLNGLNSSTVYPIMEIIKCRVTPDAINTV